MAFPICVACVAQVLPGLGVQLDDRPSGVAQVQIGDPQRMLAEVPPRGRRASAARDSERARRAVARAAERGSVIWGVFRPGRSAIQVADPVWRKPMLVNSCWEASFSLVM